MKIYTDRSVRIHSLIVFFAVLFCVALTSSAATHHTIQFGGSLGPHYSPAALDVVVGDTIIWKSEAANDFALYPLDSSIVPPGAQPLGPVFTGNSYKYIIQVPGEYDFLSKNWNFSSAPMTGTIIAAAVHNGLTNEGREFFLGMIYPNYNVAKNSFFHTYAMINTYYANEVTVNYYDAIGNEMPARIYRIPAKGSIKLPLDTQAMKVDTASDQPAFNSCHIVSKYPITVEYLSVGECSGGSYLALPNISLGKKYVAASFNDNPGQGYVRNNNNSGGSFMVIGTVDGTTVSIVPSTTTTLGHTGAIHGIGSGHNTPYPYTKSLNKGETYLVRSSGDDPENDMSGSIIEANNPVVVISGHENAYLGGTDPVIGIEARDFMIEEMVPYELWDSVGYISIPFVEPTGFAIVGHGDKYRAYTFDSTITVSFNGDVESASQFNFAAPGGQQETEITGPMEANSTNGRKISVMQYDQRSQPVQKPWPAPSMMTIVPRSHWKKYFAFNLLDNGNTGQIIDMPYINVISDHLNDIKVSVGGAAPVPLTSAAFLTKINNFGSVSVTDQSVEGIQYRLTSPVYLPASPYYFTSEYPFMVYLYEMRIAASTNLGGPSDPNDPHEYAAPTGMQLNTGVEPQFQYTIDSTTNCSSWHICVKDVSGDNPGIKTVMLVDDPDGVYFQPASKLKNVSFDESVPEFSNGELHPNLAHPTDVYCFDVKTIDPLDSALAPIAIVDNKGNALFLQLHYNASTLALALDPLSPNRADSIVFPVETVGQKICTTFVFNNTALATSPGAKPILIKSISLKQGGDYVISSISNPPPYSIPPQQADTLHLCYTATDTLRHRDSIIIQTDCFTFPISLDAHGRTGLILTYDEDFGYGIIGKKKCGSVQVQNVGSAPLQILALKLSDSVDFSIAATTLAQLPITVNAGKAVSLTVCFNPTQENPFSEMLTIVTNLAGSFTNSIKSYAYLTGTGVLQNPNGVQLSEDVPSDMLKIFPDPVSGPIAVAQFPAALNSKGVISVTDVLGRQVFRRDINVGATQTDIPTAGLPAGTYYVTLTTGEGVISQKLEVKK
jgi:hypothetical protein